MPRLPGPSWAWHASIGARALPESGYAQQVMHIDVGRALTRWLWVEANKGIARLGGRADKRALQS